MFYYTTRKRFLVFNLNKSDDFASKYEHAGLKISKFEEIRQYKKSTHLFCFAEIYDAENINFWRTANQNEVDFVIRHSFSEQSAMEVKFITFENSIKGESINILQV